MRRRKFISLLGGAAGWPLAARAQQPAMPVIGFLAPVLQNEELLNGFRQGLKQAGFVEGENVWILYRYAENEIDRLPALANDLVRRRVAVIVTAGQNAAFAAKAATATIPILFVAAEDPVKLGLVASLARPGGNATGVTLLLDDTASKRLELLKEVVPRVKRAAFLWNPDHPDNELREAQRAAESLNVRLQLVQMRGSGDLDDALRAVINGGSDALYIVSSRHTVLNIPRIVEFATRNRLPLAGGWGAWARAGGVLSYGPNVNDVTRGVVTYLDKILKGAKPADLPVQQPTKFELVINAKAAKAIGIDVPPLLLARADEVIE